jgi:uncharacterized membrane protein
MTNQDVVTSGHGSGAGSRGREWLVTAGLLALTFVPVLAGALRVGQLASGGPVTPDNHRFFAMPVPVLVHIFSASTFCVLGAFQFAAGFRRRRPRWHRFAGRVLVPSGIAAALAGLWMTLFYPLPASDDTLLNAARLFFGSAMVVSLVLGFVAILRRDVSSHRAWMMRGYAIGMGAGTQVLTILPVTIVAGRSPVGLENALLMIAAWVINLLVVEWVLRRRSNRSVRQQRDAGDALGLMVQGGRVVP